MEGIELFMTFYVSIIMVCISIPYLYLFYIIIPLCTCNGIRKYLSCEKSVPLDNPTVDEIELGNCIHSYTQPNQLGKRFLPINNPIIPDDLNRSEILDGRYLNI